MEYVTIITKQGEIEFIFPRNKVKAETARAALTVLQLAVRSLCVVHSSAPLRSVEITQYRIGMGKR